MGNLTEKPEAKCSLKEFGDAAFDFGIVDKVRIPADLTPGEYVLSWRWDCEMTKQIWNSCADVTIKVDGPATPAFTASRGCTPCCVEGGICAHCKNCLNNKTGECAKCWEPLMWWGPEQQRHWSPRGAQIQCLGNEAADGGPTSWVPGDSFDKYWSPGCGRCWATEGGCSSYVRGAGDKKWAGNYNAATSGMSLQSVSGNVGDKQVVGEEDEAREEMPPWSWTFVGLAMGVALTRAGAACQRRCRAIKNEQKDGKDLDTGKLHNVGVELVCNT
eukprot:TRINITY_DN72108_c0_g1_i1.p1 TRINITY_DN72108_c0_g1~~TRINITY_DN72108_c0_g1_i1.p1  ORF type:complete len:296 (-),score=36.93 TRINITY_DN72108_c0_g1_i1:246-1064(-)